MDIIAITVSVNYSDILEHMIAQNIRFLQKWFIITTESDIKTIELVKKYKDKIDILIYNDFYINNCKFNKGGAIKFAQDYLDIHHKNANILVLDSDIYLPDNFIECLPSILEPNTLYGVLERLDYWSLDDYIKKINPYKYPHGGSFVGFFQLYKQDSKYKYNHSENCAKCDDHFRNLFNNKIQLEISINHLGKDSVNWDGRTIV